MSEEEERELWRKMELLSIDLIWLSNIQSKKEEELSAFEKACRDASDVLLKALYPQPTMIRISVFHLNTMPKFTLSDFLYNAGIHKEDFAQKLQTRIWRLENMIGAASSIKGDAYTTTRANLSCEKFANEISVCKSLIEKLGISIDHLPQPFSQADIVRITKQARKEKEWKE